MALGEHWLKVFESRPEIDVIYRESMLTEKELLSSILTTCRTDLSCRHDYFTKHFSKHTTSVTITFEPRTKTFIFVRVK
jgi:hypothetical protein